MGESASTNYSGAQPEAKAALRREVQAVLARLSAEERSAASAQDRELLLAQPAWRHAKAILFYAPLPLELDLWPLLGEALRMGKIVALPRYLAQTRTYTPCRVEEVARDVVEGHFGIREPNEQCSALPADRLDFILVPGVAFDLHGHRLGRGQGFYDRLLATIGGRRCGVAFQEQIVGQIPVEMHDAAVHYLLTPKRWIEV
jgi:5-formyltetrahydrofolate cyclo-ligase